MIKLSGKICLIDTNVLVALINKKHQYHLQALSIFNRLKAKEFKAVISSQNILELTAVLVHGFKINRVEAAKDIRLLTQDKILSIIYPDYRALTNFFSLMKKEKACHTVDLFLLATAQAQGVEVIISGDLDFQKLQLKTIAVYNPFKPN
jgi:predicted nucleic acid-binding protein